MAVAEARSENEPKFVDLNESVATEEVSPSPERLKQIRIHSGVLSRLLKEHSFYVADAERLSIQIDGMKEKGVCVHDIKQISEVFVETKKMIPQVLVQVEHARNKLSKILGEEFVCKTSSMYLDSEALLGKANSLLNSVPHVELLDEYESDDDSEY